ncbi:pyridine nucleotide-disulfide oxidoreductase [Pseudomonas moorei]|nr:pyridine nucleotide-disulfide oxidoreductase [Pseudomonas moorei]
MKNSLVIVGASYAGVQIAASVRERGFDGSITLLGDESEAPYQRPVLSKGYLTHPSIQPAQSLRAQAFFVEERIDWRPNSRAVKIDRDEHVVALEGGERLSYDHLALTTGARVRPLDCPGANLAGVHYLRSMTDARQLREAALGARRAVVIGAGYIGLEVAASLRQTGVEVTVVEPQQRVLARVTSTWMSEFVMQAHMVHGVAFELGSGVTALRGPMGRVEHAMLSDGRSLPCDLVVVGIGVLPNVELAQDCGLVVQGGVVVDDFARTSDHSIVAAGDCAAFGCIWQAPGSSTCRIESVQNANDMAKIAAATLMGETIPHTALPWFWSDQFDLKLQMAGLQSGANHQVIRGSLRDRKFSVYYFRDETLVAVDSVNSPQDHMMARKVLGKRLSPSAQQIASESFDLKVFASNEMQIAQ